MGDSTFTPDSIVDTKGLHLAFFDRCLKDREPASSPSRARIYVTGANTWRSLDAYPPAGATPRRLYLTSGGHANSSTGDGKLSWDAPAASPPDRFTFDPKRPVPANMGEWGSDRQEVHGPHVGIRRARYRDGYDRERLLVPGKVESFRIELFDIAHSFQPGHCVRLEISSSAAPLYHPNQNTGNPVATDTEWKVAHQTIHHDRRWRSALTLSVVSSGSGAAPSNPPAPAPR